MNHALPEEVLLINSFNSLGHCSTLPNMFDLCHLLALTSVNGKTGALSFEGTSMYANM